MSRFLLDTNACIAWLKAHPEVQRRLLQAGEQRVCICAPVKAELWFGACNSVRVDENKSRLTRLFESVPCLPFDDDAALRCGEVRAELKRLGTPIGPYDLQIAAIALTRERILVTRNTREFERVSGLALEDWERPAESTG